jgi:hypothetical protein
MNTTEKGIGVAAIIMAVCCAVLPLAGGVAFSRSTFGTLAGVAVLALVVVFLMRKHRRSAC